MTFFPLSLNVSQSKADQRRYWNIQNKVNWQRSHLEQVRTPSKWDDPQEIQTIGMVTMAGIDMSFLYIQMIGPGWSRTIRKDTINMHINQFISQCTGYFSDPGIVAENFVLSLVLPIALIVLESILEQLQRLGRPRQ